MSFGKRDLAIAVVVRPLDLRVQSISSTDRCPKVCAVLDIASLIDFRSTDGCLSVMDSRKESEPFLGRKALIGVSIVVNESGESACVALDHHCNDLDTFR